MTLRHPNARRTGDEFFIGWQQRMPHRSAIAVILAAVLLICTAAGTMGVIRFSLTHQEAGIFEFGAPRAFSGEFLVEPVPMLLLDEPVDGRDAAVLVGLYKFGIPEALRRHHGQRVRFNGTAIRSPAGLMIEVTDVPSITVLERTDARSITTHVVGNVTLTGELVDTKCYFGVMRPGYGKVHRACAVRCLSGGVPPGLLLRDAAGLATVVMLRATMTPIDPQWAARTISVSGQLSICNGIPLMTADAVVLAAESP